MARQHRSRHDNSEYIYEYDCVMECLARLHAYGNCSSSTDLGEIESWGERLVKSDLINFSIHCRRLLVLADKVSLAKNVNISWCVFHKNVSDVQIRESDHPVDVWSLVGVVLHHDCLYILSSDFDIRLYVFEMGVDALLHRQGPYFPPILAVGSDKEDLICFELGKFVELVHGELIEPLVEELAKNKIFVERSIRE